MKKKKLFKEKSKRCKAFLLALLMALSLIPTSSYKAADVVLFNEATLKKDKTDVHVNLKDVGIPINCDITRKTLASVYDASDSEVAFCLDCRRPSKDNVRYARTGKADSVYVRIMNYCLNDTSINGLFGMAKGEWRNDNYALAQAMIWGYREKGNNVNEIVEVVNIVLTETSMVWQNLTNDNRTKFAKRFVESALNYSDDMGTTVYVWDAGSSVQRVLSIQSGVRVNPDIKDLTRPGSYTAKEEVVLNIKKTDQDTGKPLADVKFDLYKDNVKVSTVTTDANGNASYLFQDSVTNSTTSSVFYWCTNYNGLSVPNQQKVLNAGIYATESDAINVAVADATAKAKVEAEKLYAEKHTYKAVEVATRDEYYLKPSTSQSTTYASGDGSGSVSFNFTNTRQVGSITIQKLDKDTKVPVSGAVYGLYAKEDIFHPDGKTGIVHKQDDLVGKFLETDANGKATLDKLYLGKYYIKEISAPNGYVLSDDIYDVELTYAGNNVEITYKDVVVYDSSVRGTINVTKKDADTDFAQGDATLEGAVYGLYAKEDIVYAGSSSGLMRYNSVAGDVNELRSSKGEKLEVFDVDAKAGVLLATIETDRKGEFNFENLQKGNYYIKELAPSEGYLLDNTRYDITLVHDGKSKEIVVDLDVFEQVKKQAFDIYKVGQAEGSTTLNPLGGIEFIVKLESDVQELGWDAAPVFDVITTGNEGKCSSIELPYGTYRVKETKTPFNYIPAADFFVEVKEDSREHLSYTNNIIINKEFSAILKIIKKDAETGKIVALEGAEFKIKALTDVTVNGKNFKAGEYIGIYYYNIADGFYQTSWTTDSKGTIVLNKLGAGKYQLEETKAPSGYLLDIMPMQFEVSRNSLYDISGDGETPIITVSKTNIPVNGQIIAEKRGEVLVGFENGKFIYEERALEGAEFEVYAKEDIMDPSNDGTVLYEKGTLIEKIITGADGKATTKKLPLGKYYLVETKAVEGFVLDKDPIMVDLSYVDQCIEVVYAGTEVTNERKKVEITVIKKDAETKEALAGAVFGVYAKEDIHNADGELIVAADTSIEERITETDGTVSFISDFPFGKYYVKEMETPVGYVKSDVCFEVDPANHGDDVEVIEFDVEFENYPTKLEISKTNITGEHEIKDARLSIIDAEGNVIDSWISDGTVHYIERIPVGKYILREEIAPYGYKIANDVEFEVTETEEVQKVSMKDELVNGKIIIEKIDEDTKKGIAGVEFEIRDKYGNVIETLVTDINGHAESGELPIAVFENGNFAENIKYYVVETKAADEYILDGSSHEVVLQYADEVPEVVTYTLNITNKHMESKIPQTGDNMDPWLYVGIGLVAIIASVFAVRKKKNK